LTDLKHDLASLRLDDDAPKSRRGLWIGLIVLLVLGAGAAVAWRATATLRAMEVETVTPSIEQSGPSAAGTPILTASGYIVARREAVVSSKIQGRLSELRVEEGSVVKEGDVLARLESTDYVATVQRARALLQQAEAAIVSAQAQVQHSQADLAEARRQLSVNEKLSADKLVPVDTLDAARSRVKLAEAALAQARADEQRAEAQRQQARADLDVSEAQLANTVIRAPFAGTVVRKMAEVGESVAPIPPGVNISTASGAIVALADLATLEMEADVSESNVARLQEGQPAEVTVEAFPDRKFRSVLRQVIPTADRTKATVLTKVTLLEKDKDLKPEMSAKVTFLEEGAPADAAAGAPQKPLILVPQTAVVTRGGNPQVFEIVDGRAKARTIATGGTRRDMLIVTDGLAGTEKLVARPDDSLSDGAAVKAKGAQ
jgi:RND family efflux transporter MFP subunit